MIAGRRYRYPDVIVSTDVTHGGADNDQQSWGTSHEMNTGMLCYAMLCYAMLC